MAFRQIRKICNVKAVGSTITVVIRQLLLRAKVDKVWLLEKIFSIYFIDLTENGKISFKDILLSWE